MTDAGDASAVLYRDQRRSYPVIDRGEGVYLYDTAGKRYLDGASGAGNATIGHGVRAVVDAVGEQMARVSYVYGRQFTTEAQIRLAEKVLEWAPAAMAKVFFVSGGSEATESAIKLVRQYHVERGNDAKYKIIGRRGSYHGNTLGALSASGRPSFQKLYGPLLHAFPHVAPYDRYRCGLCAEHPGCTLDCAADLERAILAEGPETVAAFIAEPIEGPDLGVAIPPDGYFDVVREICDRHDVVFIADEVLTGFGRAGRRFACEYWNVQPDVIVCGKGISAGYAPLGAVIVSTALAEAIGSGSGVIPHGFTYGGNPLACAAGLATLDYLETNNLVERSFELGHELLERARTLEALPSVGEVRGGRGLFVGVELVMDAETRRPYPMDVGLSGRVLRAGFENGVTLIGGSGGADGQGGDCLVLAPPFVIDSAQIDELVALTAAAIRAAAIP